MALPLLASGTGSPLGHSTGPLRPLRGHPQLLRDDLYARKMDFRSYHSKRIAINREDQRYFELDYPVPSPDNRSPLKSPAAYQIVEELINHIVGQQPVTAVLPRGQSESAVTAAGKQTAWLNGAFRRLELPRFLRKSIWFDAVRGCHVWRVMDDPGAWPLRPVPPEIPADPPGVLTFDRLELGDYFEDLARYAEDKAAYQEDLADWREYTEEHFPLRLDLLDPLYCFWEPGENPQQIVISWDRPVDEILQSFPDAWPYLSSLKAGTRVSWNEYWNDEIKAYWIESYGNNQAGMGAPYFVVEPTRHELGFFPFIIDGPFETPLEEPEKHYPSIYYAIKALLQYESALITQLAHIIRINGWAPIIIKTDRQENQAPQIDMTPGKINFLQTEESAGYLSPDAQAMAILDQMVSKVAEYTDRATGLTDTLRGVSRGKSGYQQAQQQAAAMVALVPETQACERSLAKAGRMLFKALRRVGERVTVQGMGGDHTGEMSLGPKDVREVGYVECAMKPVLPIDEAQRVNNYANMTKLGWISNATAARKLGIENPEEEHERWLAEQITRDPQIMQAMGRLYAQENWPELAMLLAQIPVQSGQPGGKRGPPKGRNIASNQPGPQPRQPKGDEGQLQQRQIQAGAMAQRHLPQAQEV